MEIGGEHGHFRLMKREHIMKVTGGSQPQEAFLERTVIPVVHIAVRWNSFIARSVKHILVLMAKGKSQRVLGVAKKGKM